MLELLYPKKGGDKTAALYMLILPFLLSESDELQKHDDFDSEAGWKTPKLIGNGSQLSNSVTLT